MTDPSLPRPEVFAALLAHLEETKVIPLTPEVVAQARDIYRRTVGDFLVRTAGKGPDGDYWSDADFRRFLEAQSLLIARRARSITTHDEGATAEDVQAAAIAVIGEARHEYCEALPAAADTKAKDAAPLSTLGSTLLFGGICPTFLKQHVAGD